MYICIYVNICICIYIYICIYVYMYICIYVYMYICIYVYMYICIYVYMYICIYVYMYICIYVYMYICIYVYMYICIYVYMYICIYVYMYMCIYVYMCIYMCMCIYVYMYICIYVYMYICIYVYMYICIYVYMYICIYVYMYICIYVYMYICIYVYMYICIYVYMYISDNHIYIYTHVYTHTHPPKMNDSQQNTSFFENNNKFLEYMRVLQVGEGITCPSLLMRSVDIRNMTDRTQVPTGREQHLFWQLPLSLSKHVRDLNRFIPNLWPLTGGKWWSSKWNGVPPPFSDEHHSNLTPMVSPCKCLTQQPLKWDGRCETPQELSDTRAKVSFCVFHELLWSQDIIFNVGLIYNPWRLGTISNSQQWDSFSMYMMSVSVISACPWRWGTAMRETTCHAVFAWRSWRRSISSASEVLCSSPRSMGPVAQETRSRGFNEERGTRSFLDFTEVAVPIIINILKKDKVSDPMHFQALLCLLGLGFGLVSCFEKSCFLVCPSGVCNWKQVAPRTLQHLCGSLSIGKLSESSHDAYSSVYSWELTKIQRLWWFGSKTISRRLTLCHADPKVVVSHSAHSVRCSWSFGIGLHGSQTCCPRWSFLSLVLMGSLATHPMKTPERYHEVVVPDQRHPRYLKVFQAIPRYPRYPKAPQGTPSTPRYASHRLRIWMPVSGPLRCSSWPQRRQTTAANAEVWWLEETPTHGRNTEWVIKLGYIVLIKRGNGTSFLENFPVKHFWLFVVCSVFSIAMFDFQRFVGKSWSVPNCSLRQVGSGPGETLSGGGSSAAETGVRQCLCWSPTCRGIFHHGDWLMGMSEISRRWWAFGFWSFSVLLSQ